MDDPEPNIVHRECVQPPTPPRNRRNPIPVHRESKCSLWHDSLLLLYHLGQPLVPQEAVFGEVRFSPKEAREHRH